MNYALNVHEVRFPLDSLRQKQLKMMIIARVITSKLAACQEQIVTMLCCSLGFTFILHSGLSLPVACVVAVVATISAVSVVFL